MVSILFQFFLLGTVIALAGYFLTKFADKIAELTGLGKMFIGGMLLAASTSLPELMVDLKAVQLKMPDIAVGDLLGSSMINLLILAVLDFTFPSTFKRTAFSPTFLHHSLAALLAIFLTSLVGIGISTHLTFSFLGLSFISWGILLSYLFGFRLIYLNSVSELKQPTKTSVDKKKLGFTVGGYILSSIVLMVTAPQFVKLADQLATQSNLGHTFIGTTLVALTTSLPELVSTIVAFRMGSPDLALGNIFGSNAFNMLLFIPLDFMSPGIIYNSVAPIHAISAFSIVASMSMAIMGMVYRKKERSRFAEPSSEMIVLLILVFLFLLYKTNLS